METKEIDKLTKQLASGDVGAFDECVRIFGDRLFKYIRLFTKNDSLAEDLTQEVFLKVLDERKRLKNVRNFPGWLFRTAHNMTLNELRKGHYKRDVSLDELTDSTNDSKYHHSTKQFQTNEESPFEEMSRKDVRSVLSCALGELDEQAQQIMVLRFFGGLKVREISQTLDVPIGTVCTKVFKSLKQLKKRLVQAGHKFEDLV